MQSLLDNGLYVTCNYLTEVMDQRDAVMVVCTMKVHDIDDPTSFVIVDGCSAIGEQWISYGTGNAMSYSRKYAFLNLLNLKTGIKDEDGYAATPFNKISSVKEETGPVYLDDKVDAEEIKEYIKLAKNSKQFYSLAEKYKGQLQYLMKNNSKAYQQIKKVADAKELQLSNNV